MFFWRGGVKNRWELKNIKNQSPTVKERKKTIKKTTIKENQISFEEAIPTEKKKEHGRRKKS